MNPFFSKKNTQAQLAQASSLKVVAPAALAALMLAGCQTTPNSSTSTSSQLAGKSETETLWVNGYRQPCSAGAGKMQCLIVADEDDALTDVDADDWEYFYAPIQGFNFQQGVAQKIRVKKTHLDPATVPADASSIRYELLDVLQTQKVSAPAAQSHNTTGAHTRLHDIWAVTHINGQAIPSNSQTIQTPSMEINTQTMRVMGTDGCNQYQGSIDDLSATEIEFDDLISTRKMCVDMTVPTQFQRAMDDTDRYQLNQLTLTFLDDNGREVLRFLKVD